jgi:hypothetical protein
MVKKGPKPTYQRVIPKFLQQYTHLLQPERRPEYDEEAPTIASSSKPSSESAEGATATAAAAAAADDPFDGYTEEETAALEEYKKLHPERVVDKAALRARVKALTSSLADSSEQQTAAAGEKRKAESEAETAAAAEPAVPLEYVNEEGSIKFNKPTAAAAAAAGKAGGKKRSKKAAAAAVKNTSLLSFDDDE